MNESSNMVAALMMAFNQINSIKDKVDPQAYELFQKSAHEAIASAHSFLDACEKVLDSITEQESSDKVSDESSSEVNQNMQDSVDEKVIEFKKA